MDTETKIAALEKMKPAELRLAWRNAHGTPAPPAFSAALLARALASHYQEQKSARLTKSELRQLGALGRKDDRRKEGRVSTEAKPGTWLRSRRHFAARSTRGSRQTKVWTRTSTVSMLSVKLVLPM